MLHVIGISTSSAHKLRSATALTEGRAKFFAMFRIEIFFKSLAPRSAGCMQMKLLPRARKERKRNPILIYLLLFSSEF